MGRLIAGECLAGVDRQVPEERLSAARQLLPEDLGRLAVLGVLAHVSLRTAALESWHKPLATHHPGKIVSDLAVSLVLSGDCLADVAALRAEPGLFGPVALDPTISRAVDVLAGDVTEALAAINTARAAERARVWALAGEHAPRPWRHGG